MHVIGTAGHVDHGKSTLIEALTGVHPDRLKEEQMREMTIDLGFGWLPLSDGREIGLVDVPGHIDFIGNLLSGVGGMDAVLFVIAADEGIMPQTREHEAILRLLQISRGIIVITKVDLVADEEWLILLKEDIRKLFAGSFLSAAKILCVSAITGQGLSDLTLAIEELVDTLPEKNDFQRPRLPVDRVFQLPGIGTVVTGTLQDGVFNIGEQIVVLPGSKKGRIRELQIHQRKVHTVPPGNRTAINISGVSKDEIQRGDIIAIPGTYQPTQRLDIWIQMLKGVIKPLTHNTKLRLYLGAKSVNARVRVLGAAQLDGGESGFVQLECEEPVIAMKNDRLILRRLSPGETLAGGAVINPQPVGRHKRFSEGVLSELTMLRQENPTQLVEQILINKGVFKVSELSERLNSGITQTEEILAPLIQTKKVFFLADSRSTRPEERLLVHQEYWQRKQAELLRWITAFHTVNPLRWGASLLQLREQFSKDLGILPELLQSLLRDGAIVEPQKQIYALPGFSVQLNPQQKNMLNKLVTAITAIPHTPPPLRELNALIGEQTMKMFIEAGFVIKVSDDLVYTPEQIEAYRLWLVKTLDENGTMQLGEFRDHFQTSRKYAQGVLEYFDRMHVTERMDNIRKRYQK